MPKIAKVWDWKRAKITPGLELLFLYYLEIRDSQSFKASKDFRRGNLVLWLSHGALKSRAEFLTVSGSAPSDCTTLGKLLLFCKP